MVLNETDAAFRDTVRAFLAAELTDELCTAGRRCSGIFSDYPDGIRWLRRRGLQRLGRAGDPRPGGRSPGPVRNDTSSSFGTSRLCSPTPGAGRTGGGVEAEERTGAPTST